MRQRITTNRYQKPSTGVERAWHANHPHPATAKRTPPLLLTICTHMHHPSPCTGCKPDGSHHISPIPRISLTYKTIPRACGKTKNLPSASGRPRTRTRFSWDSASARRRPPSRVGLSLRMCLRPRGKTRATPEGKLARCGEMWIAGVLRGGRRWRSRRCLGTGACSRRRAARRSSWQVQIEHQNDSLPDQW